MFMKIISIILQNKGKVLLLKRVINAEYNPGEWEFVSGNVKKGESLKEAAIREAFEETGIVIKDIKQGSSFRFVDENKWDVFTFSAEVIDDKVVLGHEHSEYIWVHPEEIEVYDAKNGDNFLSLVLTNISITK